ncbi:thioredoxin fold domain-containing protein [Flavobacterium sp. J27]|uniref:thioredoxin family protein n=1 Tax=Flavobacterium sp. J27 TaxID=2060419 RepID=UPI00102F842C|nr:thioredoxin fold domain-containing protein [Flavobacterium sp. J27]
MKKLKINSLISFFSFCFIVAFSSFESVAQNKTSTKTDINFSEKTYVQVLEIAKANHKKIFVDAYATWCAPCKQLQKTTFKDAKAAAYFNKNFINISIDVEKGEGLNLAKTWAIEGLPTLLILNEDGEIIGKHVGYVDGNGLLEFAKEVSSK